MKKRYILMTIEKDLKYEGFERHHFKLFDSYIDIQKHLKNFWFMNRNNYVIFEETSNKRDFSYND